MKTISESDWRKFKKVREKALDKLCARVLRDCKDAIDAQGRSNHEKYLRLYELINGYDERIAEIFNGLARSSAEFQLMLMNLEGLIEEDDIRTFSPDIQGLLRRQV